MKVGAERKKVIALVALLLVAAVLYYINSQDDAPPSAVARTTTPSVSAQSPATAAPPAARPSTSQVSRPSQRGRREQDFRPTLKLEKPGSRTDPTSIDPTLRLDLLAKVQSVMMQGGERNLFQFGAAPAPKIVAPKILPNNAAKAEQQAAPVVPQGPPKPPPPPPIPLKFYGYASQTQPGVKRAFFLNGDEIVVAAEGDVISRRYKVVRIGLNSAVVEDTDVKNQQTLPLEEQAG